MQYQGLHFIPLALCLSVPLETIRNPGETIRDGLDLL